MNNNITIYTIAEMANVSISTVSRILNNNFSGKEEIRERVLEVVEKTKYQPNQSARRLTGKKLPSKMIGVMAPFFIDPFFVEVLKGIYKVLHQEGYHLIIYDVDSHYLKKNMIQKIIKERILDGLLMVNMHLNVNEYKDITDKMSLVIVSAATDFSEYVMVDNYKGIVLGMEYIQSLGHKCVAFINNEKQIEESRIREKAFLDKANEFGMKYKIDYRKVDRLSGYLAAKNIILNNPEVTCLFYFSDLMAYGGLDFINENALRGKISIIGFDGFEMTFQMKLTTVVQPMEEMGKKGVTILLEKIRRGNDEKKRIILNPWLEKGETCWRISDDE